MLCDCWPLTKILFTDMYADVLLNLCKESVSFLKYYKYFIYFVFYYNFIFYITIIFYRFE